MLKCYCLWWGEHTRSSAANVRKQYLRLYGVEVGVVVQLLQLLVVQGLYARVRSNEPRTNIREITECAKKQKTTVATNKQHLISTPKAH